MAELCTFSLHHAQLESRDNEKRREQQATALRHGDAVSRNTRPGQVRNGHRADRSVEVRGKDEQYSPSLTSRSLAEPTPRPA
jgi:hypothetical protein